MTQGQYRRAMQATVADRIRQAKRLAPGANWTELLPGWVEARYRTHGLLKPARRPLNPPAESMLRRFISRIV